MGKAATAMEILLHFLRTKTRVSSHTIETELPNYGKLLFMTYYNPATYSRIFRKLRQDGAELLRLGLTITDITNEGDTESTWSIQHRAQFSTT